MGKELEYKVFVPDKATLDKVIDAPEIAALVDGPWQEKPMKTTYFDTPGGAFAMRHWTFRHRLEGEESVVCVKTPTKESHTRGEWQVFAEQIDDSAVEALLAAGAPKELLYLYAAGELRPLCGAEFTRKCVMLRFPDGSRAELAADHGLLRGARERLDFTELELELYEGEPQEMLSLLRLLMERFHLREQPLSKFARAKALK